MSRCGQIQTVRMTYQYSNDKWHLFAVTCTVCDNKWYYGSHTCGAERRLAQAEGHARIAADLPNRLGTTWGAWTQNSDEKTHTRICKRDTSHTETENCHGGTATCTAKAICTVCGGEYGEMAAHSFTAEKAEAQYLKSAATCTEKAVYYKSCAVCQRSKTYSCTRARRMRRPSSPAIRWSHDWGVLDAEQR